MSKPLSEGEIKLKLGELNGWIFENDCLKRNFEFSNFRDAMSFLFRISFEADQRDHHPEILISNLEVTVEIYTHDINDVTEHDISLSKFVDEVYGEVVLISQL